MTDEIYNIIGKRILNEELTAGEKAEFDNWLTMEGSEDELRETEKVWEIALRTKKDITPDIDAEWKRFNELRAETNNNRRTINLFNYKSAIAAGIALLISLSIVLFNNFNRETVIASNNTSIETILPDNSVVKLNANSELKYIKNFGKKHRSVELKGEAYFNVEKSDVPFIISTGSGVQTRVLGTQFNLKAKSGSNVIELNVTEGLVEFGNTETGKKVKVGVNQKAVYSVTNNELSETTMAVNDIAWYTGKLSFDNTPLKEVKEALESFYDISISIPDDMLNNRFSGKYEQPELKELAEIISISFNREYSLSENKLEFK